MHNETCLGGALDHLTLREEHERLRLVVLIYYEFDQSPDNSSAYCGTKDSMQESGARDYSIALRAFEAGLKYTIRLEELPCLVANIPRRIR
jgi:hypothetical protein